MLTHSKIRDELRRNEIRGRAVGASLFSLFGALWLGLGLYVSGNATAASALGVMTGVTLMTVSAAWLALRSKSLPLSEEGKMNEKAFHWINAAHWIAIAAGAAALSSFGLGVYVLSSVAIIVGLHLLPLARVLRYRAHYVTGSALIAWSIATAALLSGGQMQAALGFGAGTILWLSAAFTLVRTAARMKAWQTAP